MFHELVEMVNRWLGPDDWMDASLRIRLDAMGAGINCRRNDELVEDIPRELTAFLMKVRSSLPFGVLPVEVDFMGWPALDRGEAGAGLSGIICSSRVAGVEIENPDAQTCDRAVLAVKEICRELPPGEMEELSRDAYRQPYMILERFQGGETMAKATVRAASPEAAVAKYLAVSFGAKRLDGVDSVKAHFRSGRTGALLVTEAPTAVAELFDVQSPTPRYRGADEIEF